MNAVTRVAPPLTAERLIAIVKVLPPLKTMSVDRRERIEVAIGQCEKDATPPGCDFADPDDAIFYYRRAPFTRLSGDPGYVEQPADDECDPFARNPNFDGQDENDWIVHLRDDVPTPKDPWNHLLDEAERMVPDFNRWSLPGARFSVVGEASGASAAPLQVWSDDDDDDDDATPAMAWVVADMILAHSLACFVGEPGEGKTALALSLAVRIAAGLPFAGREVRQGVVVYVAAEGHPAGLKARVTAMRQQYGVDRGGARIIRINGADSSLCRPADVERLINTITAEARGEPVRAVFLDTLSQMMPGQDESGATAMGQAVASMSRVRDAFSTAVVVIHHPAKGGRDPRGHGSLKGALDALFFVSAKHKHGGIETATMENTKQREARLAPDCVFEAAAIEEAFVPRYREAEATPAALATTKPKLSAKATLVLAFLVKHGPVTEAAWRTGVARQITASANIASQRTAFARVRDELIAARAVELGDGSRWRTVV